MSIETFKIVMPLMRAVQLPHLPNTEWWNIWGKAKNAITMSKPRMWIIEEEYLLYFPNLDEVLCIPKGFVFDGASVPRVLWPFMSPTGCLFLSGLFHDFGYRYGCYYDKDRNIIHFGENREFFDENFKNMGIHINNAKGVSRTAWFGLFCFGFISWNRHRINNQHPYTLFPKNTIKE